MGFFEEQRGLPPGDYSREFLEIDAEAGPWLTERQRQSVIFQRGYSQWDLDLEGQVLRFKGEDRGGAIAAFQILGTFDPETGHWLWSWANPKLAPLSPGVAKIRDENPDVSELVEPVHICSEAKAWALAAAAGMKMEAEGCFRLTGEVFTFVALFNISEYEDEAELGPAGPDPAGAHEALAAYAGPATLAIGGLLIEALERGEPLDPVIEKLYGFCENLEELARSPLGRSTPAAREAQELSAILRQGALCLSSPPETQGLADSVQEILSLLRDVAARYGAIEDTRDNTAPDE